MSVIITLPVEFLTDSSRNFFRPLAEDQLQELAQSISRSGIIHPLVVRPLGDGRYEIISGHQRKRAALLLGLKEVPCRVVETAEEKAELMLIDANLQTRQLSPMEMARAVRRRKELAGIRQGVRTDLTSDMMSEVAGQLGVTDRHLRRLDKLNDLIPELQEMVDDERLGVTAGEKLASLPPDAQKLLFEALGDGIGRVRTHELNRLREESDRGYLVLEVMEKRTRELEDELSRIKELHGGKDALESELERLRQKKKELEYDILDRQAAARAVQDRTRKSGAMLLELVEGLGRPVLAARPEIEALTREQLEPGIAVHVDRWARVFREIAELLEGEGG